MNLKETRELLKWMKSIVPVKTKCCIMAIDNDIELRWEWEIQGKRYGYSQILMDADIDNMFLSNDAVLNFLKLDLLKKLEKLREKKD